jgi:NAD(P)-dependent dehydrogenase (short-subunit alcohol dehydrogenase family)
MNILITGGASGLGMAITKKLADNPVNKIYFSFNNSLAQAEQLQQEFKNTIGIKCNFTSKEEIAQVISTIEALNIEVLINNAYSGNPVKTYFHKMTEDDFESEFMNNTMPVISLTKACIKNFRKHKSGKIITILTSYLLNTPPVCTSAYVANKAFLASLVKSWAVENIKYNITSNAVSPSFMLTGLATGVDERIVEQITQTNPLKKLLTVEEVADSVAFLVNAPLQINGLDIVLNAGINVK